MCASIILKNPKENCQFLTVDDDNKDEEKNEMSDQRFTIKISNLAMFVWKFQFLSIHIIELSLNVIASIINLRYIYILANNRKVVQQQTQQAFFFLVCSLVCCIYTYCLGFFYVLSCIVIKCNHNNNNNNNDVDFMFIVFDNNENRTHINITLWVNHLW